MLQRPAERRAHVVVLMLDPVEPGNGVAARQQVGFGVLGELDQPFGVGSAHGVAFTDVEQRERVAPDGLEHREAVARALHEAVVDERAEHDDVDVADALGGLERPPAGEDGQSHERLALAVVEQFEAPRDRRRQRPLARRSIARARAEQLRATLEPRQQLRRREVANPRRGQLERKREPVEAAADRRHARGVRVVQREGRIGGARACGEEPDGVVAAKLLDRRGKRRQRQRRDGVDVLAREAQRRAAGGEDAQPRRRREQLGQPFVPGRSCSRLSSTSSGASTARCARRSASSDGPGSARPRA